MDLVSAAESATSALESWKVCAATVRAPRESHAAHHRPAPRRKAGEREYRAPVKWGVLAVLFRLNPHEGRSIPHQQAAIAPEFLRHEQRTGPVPKTAGVPA